MVNSTGNPDGVVSAQLAGCGPRPHSARERKGLLMTAPDHGGTRKLGPPGSRSHGPACVCPSCILSPNRNPEKENTLSLSEKGCVCRRGPLPILQAVYAAPSGGGCEDRNQFAHPAGEYVRGNREAAAVGQSVGPPDGAPNHRTREACGRGSGAADLTQADAVRTRRARGRGANRKHSTRLEVAGARRGVIGAWPAWRFGCVGDAPGLAGQTAGRGWVSCVEWSRRGSNP